MIGQQKKKKIGQPQGAVPTATQSSLTPGVPAALSAGKAAASGFAEQYSPPVPNIGSQDDGTVTSMTGSDLSQTTQTTESTQDDRSVEQMVEDLVRNRLAGADNIDTSQEDALIREMMQQNIGGGRVGNRAAMGARGFAESGAALAMGADIERAARQQALDEMLGVRQREEEQAWAEAMGAAGMDIDYQRAANEAAALDARNQLLEAILNPDPTDEPTPENGGGNNGGGPGIDTAPVDAMANDPLSILTGDAGGGGSNALATTAPGEKPANADSFPEVSRPPQDYDDTRKYTDEDGNTWTMYHTPNGWVRYQNSYSMPTQDN